MGIITIKVDDKVEANFRKVAKKTYKGKKGYLGKGVTEAMEKWLQEKRMEKMRKEAIETLEKGFEGKEWKFNREEIHER